MKIRFITGFSGFGGSTIALIEHCKLLSGRGHEVLLYGHDNWPERYFSGFLHMSEFESEKDDILVFHLWELSSRPECRRCFLYLHERSLYDLATRATEGFDQILFVSDSQRRFHGREGIVVPNPMSRLVDPSKHTPPNANVAGVVGTIQPRKRQHVSVARAIEDDRSMVVLFGNYVEPYFSEHVKPLLSERVIYAGYVPPENRMDMYSSFDVLYNFSEDESACLVTGECAMLGKPVVKSAEVEDYPLAAPEEVALIWEKLFYGDQHKND